MRPFDSLYACICVCVVLISLTLLSPRSHAAPLPLAGAPAIAEMFIPLYDAWFAMAGLSYQIVPCPLARCSSLLDNNGVVGDVVRFPEFASLHPELVMVPPAVASIGIYAITLAPLPAESSLPALIEQKKRFACIRNTSWCKSHLPEPQVHWLNSNDQGIPLLQRGCIDVLILYGKSRAEPGYNPIQHSQTHAHFLETNTLHLYLHANQAPAIASLVHVWPQLQNSPQWTELEASLQQKLEHFFVNQGK